jgi:transcriptional regulator with XRE-family HTH domain
MEAERFLGNLGRAIRQARQTNGLSQEELSLVTGIHRNYIGGIERGERSPTVRVVLTLEEALELSPGDLFARAATLSG